MKPNQHLGRGLSSDAAIDIRFAGKEASRTWVVPQIGNGVAQENDTALIPGGRGELAVRLTVAPKTRPVLQPCLCPIKPLPDISAVVARCKRWRRGGRQVDQHRDNEAAATAKHSTH